MKHFDSHVQELLRGASIAFVLKILAAVLGFVFNIVIAHSLGADGTGLFFLALILVSIAATLGQFGTAGALVRFISAGVSEGSWNKVKGVYQQSVLLSVIASLFLSIGLFFSASFISHHIFNKPDLSPILQLMSIAVLPVAFYSLQAAALQGLKQIRDANIVSGVLVPSFALLACVTLFYENSLYVVGVAYVVATVLTMLVGVYFWRSYLLEYKKIKAHFEFPILMKSAVPLFSIDVFNLLLMWNAPLLLGIWGSESDVGVFQIANRIAMLTSFVLLAVNSIFAPKLSECFAKGDRQLANSLIKKSTGLMLLMAAPILLVMIIFPEEIMMIFGEEFRDGADLLVILVVAQFINVATGSVGQILIMSGNEMKLQHAFMVTAITSLFISFFLIQEFGAIGAAFSVAIGVIMVKFVAAYFVFRYVRY